jgi:arylsulfatase
MVPTVLEAIGVEAPAAIRGVTQSPIQGVSFAAALSDASAPDKHHTQYFEMFGHRSIYHDGWRAVCPVPGPSFAEAGVGFGEMEITEEKLRELDAHGWELYDVRADFSETRNLASERRDKLIEMIAIWYAETNTSDILPIDGRGTARLAEERPQLALPRNLYVYYPKTSVVSNKIAPHILNRKHAITATVELREGESGVLVAQGGGSGGYALYLKDHRLHYAYNYLGVQHFEFATDATIGEGRHELRFEFEPTAPPDIAHGKGTPARAQLYIDGKLAAQSDLPVTIPLDIGIIDGLSCGRDEGSAVTTAYTAPFPFTGNLEKVVVDVSGDLIEDKAAQLRAVMAHQ